MLVISSANIRMVMRVEQNYSFILLTDITIRLGTDKKLVNDIWPKGKWHW